MFDKVIPDGTLKKFKMHYLGGYPGQVKRISMGVNFFITKNDFVIRSTFCEATEAQKKNPLLPMCIPYEDTISCDYVQKRVTLTDFSNEIHITCLVEDIPCTIRLGTTKMLSLRIVAECERIIDFLRENGIFDKFRKPAPTTLPQSDVPSLIQQLADLHKSGALTDDEFQNKKVELLNRL